MKRRKFIGKALKSTATISACSMLPALTFARETAYTIDSIELYRYDSNISRYFSWRLYTTRPHDINTLHHHIRRNKSIKN